MHKDDPLSNLPSVENTDSSSAPSDSATMDFPADGEHQGIFSSNDTRIETENLPDIPEVAQQAPMSSISPALRTTSTVTGDLKLGDTKSRRSKKPLIIGGIAIVVAVVITIVIIIAKVLKNDAPITLGAAYDKLISSLNNSPNGEYQYDPGNPEMQERFYTIVGELLNQAEEGEYYNSLENNYRSLRDLLKNSNKKSLQGLGEQLEDIFPIHLAMIRQSDINDKLLYDVAYDNDKEAKELISKISDLAQGNPVNRAEKSARYFAKYLETTYALYSIYQAQGCIQSDGSSFDLDCVKNIPTSKVAELQQQSKELLSLAEINAELLHQDFYSLLNNIKLEAEKDNE